MSIYSAILHAASGQWFLGQMQNHRVHVLTQNHVDQLADFLNQPQVEAQFKAYLQSRALKREEENK